MHADADQARPTAEGRQALAGAASRDPMARVAHRRRRSAAVTIAWLALSWIPHGR